MRKKAALEKINELEKELQQSNLRLNALNVQYEKLLNDYRVCYTALESSQKRIKELSESREVISLENETLRSHNAHLCEENEMLRQETKAVLTVRSVEDVDARDVSDEVLSQSVSRADNVPETNRSKSKVELSAIEKYGSSVIGSVVMEATRVIGTLTGKNSPNAKDTLSLALGRTEVLKSEVLAVVRDKNLTDQEKKEHIDRSRDQAMEYLVSVEAQD